MIQIPRRVYYLKVLICPSFLLYLNSCKMAERLRDTCLIVGLRDIICCLLYGFMAIFHGNANSSHADHAEVILPVSKAHGGLWRFPDVRQDGAALRPYQLPPR